MTQQFSKNDKYALLLKPNENVLYTMHEDWSKSNVTYTKNNLHNIKIYGYM